MQTEPLIDSAGIAALLKCERDYVTRVIVRKPDFPPPKINVSRKMRQWETDKVLAWAERPRSSR